MSKDSRETTDAMPTAFEAWDDHAAYVTATLTRAQAITEAREVCWALRDDYTRRELRAVRVFMRPVSGAEANEALSGEFERGWIEVNHRPLNAAQRAHLIAMWKVEPR
jgi:hypothetical protein